jgi:hypothetical protein
MIIYDTEAFLHRKEKYFYFYFYFFFRRNELLLHDVISLRKLLFKVHCLKYVPWLRLCERMPTPARNHDRCFHRRRRVVEFCHMWEGLLYPNREYERSATRWETPYFLFSWWRHEGTGYSIKGAVKTVLIVEARKNYKRVPTKSIASVARPKRSVQYQRRPFRRVRTKKCKMYQK